MFGGKHRLHVVIRSDLCGGVVNIIIWYLDHIKIVTCSDEGDFGDDDDPVGVDANDSKRARAADDGSGVSTTSTTTTTSSTTSTMGLLGMPPLRGMAGGGAGRGMAPTLLGLPPGFVAPPPPIALGLPPGFTPPPTSAMGLPPGFAAPTLTGATATPGSMSFGGGGALNAQQQQMAGFPGMLPGGGAVTGVTTTINPIASSEVLIYDNPLVQMVIKSLFYCLEIHFRKTNTY